jgi:hypothetical protein
MAGQTRRDTQPITSADTIALITQTLIPAIDEIKGDIKVINNKLENIACDTKDVNEIIKTFRATLYGNGNPDTEGLVTRVAKLKEWIDTRSAYEKLVITTIIIELLGLIFLFIRDAMM